MSDVENNDPLAEAAMCFLEASKSTDGAAAADTLAKGFAAYSTAAGATLVRGTDFDFVVAQAPGGGTSVELNAMTDAAREQEEGWKSFTHLCRQQAKEAFQVQALNNLLHRVTSLEKRVVELATVQHKLVQKVRY